MAENEAARDAREIGTALDRKPGCLEEAGDGTLLPCPDLNAGDAAGCEQARDFGREAAVIVKPLRPGEQRLVWLPIGDVAGKAGAVLDIRRIAEDELEPLVETFRPIADPEQGALSEV